MVRNACVVVLGDIGRSPRMQYHSISLLKNGFNVDIIGYVETKPIEELTVAQPKCKIHALATVPVTNLTPKLKMIFKTIWQTLSLLIALLCIRRPNFLLIQNPPGVPTLVVCYLYCLITRTRQVIDWHNYTYTILALGESRGENSYMCRLAKWIEGRFGVRADAHLCVTKAMQADLLQRWGIGPTTVLYDRPPEQFQSIDIAAKHDIYMKLSKEYSQFRDYMDVKVSGVIEANALTQKLSDGSVSYRTPRLAVLVSSTSWTVDEDFGILFKALAEYESIATERPNSFPKLLCIITGKGPQKEQYVAEIKNLNWRHVDIITPWLEVEDYPIVLAAADLGVCLHWSSSGLDLPMKVVDMFGCGLPVCAYKFNCLHELVIHGQNGFIFENYKELADQLAFWFENFPSNPSLLQSKEVFRKNLQEFKSLRWNENWTVNALPIFNKFA